MRADLAAGAALAFALLASAGCSDLNVGPIEDSSCARDEQCGDDVCLLGQCTAADEGLLTEVDLEIRPPDATGLPTQQILGFDTTIDDRILIELKDQAALSGAVCVNPSGDECGPDAPEASPVPGRVVAVPTSSIPGRRLVASTQTDGQGAYALSLVEQAEYSLRVYPDDESRAPYFRAEPWYSGFGGAGAERDIALPSSAELVDLTGRVVAGEGAAAIGLPQVRVLVQDGARRVSSVGVTNADGAFEVELSHDVGSGAVLLVKATEQNPGVPEVAFPDLDLEESADLGDLSLGTFGTNVRFVGTVTGNDDQLVSGASVYLRGDVGMGEIRRLVTTGEAGAFDADLPPGEYDIVAVAPPHNPTAGMYQSGQPLQLSAEAAPLDLVLQARVQASGHLRAADGTGVADASITLVRLGPPQGQEDPVLKGTTWQFTATTGAEGDWSAQVDPGRYRILCQPPPESLAPSWSVIADVFASPEPIDIDLPPHAVLAGQLLLPGSEMPVGEGAEVRVFARQTSQTGEALPLGTVTTDSEGKFGLLLPDLFATSTEPEGNLDAGVPADGGM